MDTSLKTPPVVPVTAAVKCRVPQCILSDVIIRTACVRFVNTIRESEILFLFECSQAVPGTQWRDTRDTECTRRSSGRCCSSYTWVNERSSYDFTAVDGGRARCADRFGSELSGGRVERVVAWEKTTTLCVDVRIYITPEPTRFSSTSTTVFVGRRKMLKTRTSSLSGVRKTN